MANISSVESIGDSIKAIGRNEQIRQILIAAGAEIIKVLAHGVRSSEARRAFSARNAGENRSAFADQGNIRILADGDDCAAEFVTERQRVLLLACAQFEDTGNIRAADAAGADLQEQLLFSRSRNRYFIRSEIIDCV